LVSGISGSFAIASHDLISTPLDVIKQRMQVYNSKYRSIFTCFKEVLKKEGIKPFYQSFPITFLMNIPHTATHFMTYEALKFFLNENFEEENGSLKSFFAGFLTGIFSAALSNPFDVIKTRIQTQGEFGRNYTLKETILDLYKQHGLKFTTIGIVPRIFFFAPSAGITWATYENVKKLLNIE
jgi:solute carrier family 25 (mitochondrial iron transporter), member 28/37